MYLFYIDESGTESLNPTFIQDPNSRFYVLTAVAVYENRWKSLERELTDFKFKLFPNVDLSELEVHMNVLKHQKSIKAHRYFSLLSGEKLDSLVDHYFQKICDGNITLFSVVIDKQCFVGTPAALIEKAHELLIERIENFLREYHSKHNGLIIYDEKTPKNTKALTTLQQAFIRKRRTSATTIQHLIEIPFFVKSEYSNGIQLADMCAFSVNKAFSRNDFTYPEFARILPYFYKSTQSLKKKYDGIKVFPKSSPLSKWEANDPTN